MLKAVLVFAKKSAKKVYKVLVGYMLVGYIKMLNSFCKHRNITFFRYC